MAKHFKKFRGLTDKQLLAILVTHEEAINRQAEALRWVLRVTGHPAFQGETAPVEAEVVPAETPEPRFRGARMWTTHVDDVVLRTALREEFASQGGDVNSNADVHAFLTTYTNAKTRTLQTMFRFGD